MFAVCLPKEKKKRLL